MSELPAGVTSVIASRDGVVQFEVYAPGIDVDTRHNTRSVTKTVTGLLVGAAIDRGLVHGVSDSISTYLPDAPSAMAAITLHDLLTMSSCLDCDDADPASPGNEENMYPAANWVQFATAIPLLSTRNSESTRRFRYCTAGTVLLGAAVAAAAGSRLEQFAHEVLLGPLGVEEEVWFRGENGVVFPGGGLELRSRDLLALGRVIAEAGRGPAGPLISPAWIATTMTAHVAIDATTSYGYLMWSKRLVVHGREVTAWMMLGNGGSKVAVIPSEDVVVVVTATNYNTPGMHELTEALLEETLPTLISSGS
jgi:CubicO group peptidase (beta-lactamase class C family)